MLVCAGTIRAQMNDVHNEIATARTIAPLKCRTAGVTRETAKQSCSKMAR